jgi:hypothetical protein
MRWPWRERRQVFDPLLVPAQLLWRPALVLAIGLGAAHAGTVVGFIGIEAQAVNAMADWVVRPVP